MKIEGKHLSLPESQESGVENAALEFGLKDETRLESWEKKTETM